MVHHFDCAARAGGTSGRELREAHGALRCGDRCGPGAAASPPRPGAAPRATAEGSAFRRRALMRGGMDGSCLGRASAATPQHQRAGEASPRSGSARGAEESALKAVFERLKQMSDALLDVRDKTHDLASVVQGLTARVEANDKRLDALQTFIDTSEAKLKAEASDRTEQTIQLIDHILGRELGAQQLRLGSVEEQLKAAETKLGQQMQAGSDAASQPVAVLPNKVGEDDQAKSNLHTEMEALWGEVDSLKVALTDVTHKCCLQHLDANEVKKDEKHGVAPTSGNITLMDMMNGDTSRDVTEPVKQEEADKQDSRGQADYAFSGTVWNASMFIGHGRIGVGGSAMVTLAMLINIIVQIVFLGITELIFTKPKFPFDGSMADNLRDWRVRVGHHVQHYDRASFTSLVQRVCNQEGFLEMSDSKSSLYGDMQDFLPDPDRPALAIFSGPSLIVIAVTVWTLTVLVEVRDIGMLAKGLSAVPKGRSTVLSEEGDKVRLSQLGVWRLLGILVILMIRSTVAVLLLWKGSTYLVEYSIAPADLVLNAVALKVILEVNEIIYQVVAPLQVQVLLDRMEPLPCKWNPKCHGADCSSCCAVLFLAGWLIFTWLSAVSPMMTRVQEANQTLCSGELGFVYALDPLYLVFSSPVDPLDMQNVNEKGFEQAVLNRMHPPDRAVDTSGLCVSISMVGLGVDAVMQHTTNDLQQAVTYLHEDAFKDTCEDIYALWSNFEACRQGWGDTTPSCQAMSEGGWCTHNYSYARAVCSKSCGCGSPNSTLFVASAADGCPQGCSTSRDWVAQLRTMPCIEKKAVELLTDPIWNAWAVQFDDLVRWKLNDWNLVPALLCNLTHSSNSSIAWHSGNCTAMFLSLGCQIVDYWRRLLKMFAHVETDPCTGNWFNAFMQSKALMSMCPSACGCSGEDADALVQKGCPASCAGA